MSKERLRETDDSLEQACFSKFSNKIFESSIEQRCARSFRRLYAVFVARTVTDISCNQSQPGKKEEKLF